MNKMEKLNNHIIIRKGTLSDLEDIVSNNLKMAKETENKLLEKSKIHDGVKALLIDDFLGSYYLACVNKQNVGQIMVTKEWSDWRNGFFWWIQSVYVQQRFRKIGVYHTLHNHIKQTAKQESAVGLRLYVDLHNLHAQQVYEHLKMEKSNYQLYEDSWAE